MASAAVVAKFAEVNALPSSEVKTPVGDRNRERHAEERGFCVSGHIVETFEGVVVVWFAFGNESVHDFRQVGAHVRVGVFVDAQGA